MAKIRALKPEFFTDERIVELSPLARLLYQGLWVHACDNGHVEDRPKQLKLRILPADMCDASELLDEMAALGLIIRADGWISIPTLTGHQKTDSRYFLRCDYPGCRDSDSAKNASSAARFGNHRRWHEGRGRVDPDCEFCPRDPDEATSGAHRVPVVDPMGPVVATERPNADGDGDSDGDSDDDRKRSSSDAIGGDFGGDAARDDVEGLLGYLDARITAEGIRTPPKRTKANRDAARLMLDRDRRDPHEIRRVIDWATADPFWASNIGSAAKLREKYETLHAQMRRPRAPSRQQQTDDIFTAALNRAASGENVFQPRKEITG